MNLDKNKLKVYNDIRADAKNRGKSVGFVSYSKVEKYLKCKQGYKLQYLDKLKVDYAENIYADLGTVSGDILNWASTEGWSKEKIKESFRNKAKDICTKHGLTTNIPLMRSMINFFDTSHYMTDLYNRGVKLEFEVPVYKKLNYTQEGYIDKEFWIVGFIDMVIHNEDGTISIVDFKTSNVSGYTGKKLEQNLVQIYSYAYLYESMYRKKVKNVGYHFLKYCNISCVDSKGKKRKRSKVERKDIDGVCYELDFKSNLEIEDCLNVFEYNKDNRLTYMGIFMKNFLDSQKDEEFCAKDRDKHYCKNFCPFREGICLYEDPIEKEPNPMEVMADILNGRL